MLLFTQLDLFPGRPCAGVFQGDQEERLSDYLTEVFVTSRTLVDDETITAAVDTMTRRLLSTMDEPRYDYTVFLLVRNSSVNGVRTARWKHRTAYRSFCLRGIAEEVVAVPRP